MYFQFRLMFVRSTVLEVENLRKAVAEKNKFNRTTEAQLKTF